MRNAITLLIAAALLSACGSGQEDGPIAASVIGGPPTIVDPSQRPLDTPSAALLGATAQGLVRFDAAGQIESGLAIRWAVSDDGLYYTFRLAGALGMDADDVARRLRAAIGPTSRNPLKPLLGGIVEIVAVTPEVVEIRLTEPQPTLLTLLAQPELALVADGAGTGPLSIAIRFPHSLLLTPAVDPDADPILEDERQRREVRFRGERAARAVARFMGDEAALVLGGSIIDLPIARAAGLPARVLRFDPVSGLFGFEIVAVRGFLVPPENRRALAMAIDRDAIGAAFAIPNWRPVTGIVPAGLPAPARPDWSDTDIDLRRLIARNSVGAWIKRVGERPSVRVAMPDGPGARQLFGLVSRDWAAIGVIAQRVPLKADADLRLIDIVAPSDSPDWYLRHFACGRAAICSDFADAALAASQMAEADVRLADTIPFLPIAAPVRWSLVTPRLAGYQDNARAAHPLIHLRPEKQ